MAKAVRILGSPIWRELVKMAKRQGKTERKRPDWPMRTYSYWVEPIGEIPDSFWTAARAMRELWNDLVGLHDALLERIGQLSEEEAKAQKPALYKAFTQAIYARAKKTPVSNYCYYAVVDSFRAALQRFYTKTGPRGGKPSLHHGLREIRIVHSFFNGGEPVSWLTSSERRPVQLSATSGAYDEHRQEWSGVATRGRFRIAGEDLHFKINLHRPLPMDAILKRIILKARLVRGIGFQWSLNFSCEEPPYALSRARTNQVAALDIGWRKFPDYIRVGYLADNEGNNFEFRLPLEFGNAHMKKQNARLRQRGVTWRYIDSIKELEEEQGKQGNLLDETKERLRQMGLSGLMPSGAAWQKMRQGGLYRLLRTVRDESPNGDLRATLEDWAERDHAYQRRIAGAQKAWLNFRDYFYREIAVWLAERYDELVIEDFDLHMAAQTDDVVLKYARRYKQLASTSTLRYWINVVGKREGLVIHKYGKFDPSTALCSICDGAISAGPNLLLQCADGHLQDQDSNATAVMLDWLIERSGCERSPGVGASLERSRIPRFVRLVSR